jgi:hypothetical protein
MIICEPIALFAYLIIVFITVIEPKEDDALLLQREKDENERL